MGTTKLVEKFLSLRDELFEQGPSENWVARRRILALALKVLLLQRSYERERMKPKYGLNIVYSKAGIKLREKEGKNLKEATAVNKQIGRRLREIREGK